MKFILIVGQPGTGKTTLGRALSSSTPDSAYIDTDALISVNPFNPLELDELIFENIRALSDNFIKAEYQTIIISGGIRDQETFDRLASQLPAGAEIVLILLKAEERVRRERKEARARDVADSGEHFDFLNKLYPAIEHLNINDNHHATIISIETSSKSPQEVFNEAKKLLQHG